jgi:hypothetical protein
LFARKQLSTSTGLASGLKLLLLLLKSFVSDRSFAQGAIVVLFQPFGDAGGVEEVPFIAGQLDDFIGFFVLEEADRAGNFLTARGSRGSMISCVVEVLHKLWRCRYPVGTLGLT